MEEGWGGCVGEGVVGGMGGEGVKERVWREGCGGFGEKDTRKNIS